MAQGLINKKQIAINTFALYVRMAVTMVVGLYTSRVVLAELGEVDFGLYTAVGGVAVAFSFLNGVLSAACNRYFAIEMGRGDDVQLRKVFCQNLTIYALLCLFVVVLAESAGLWFVNNKLVFPPERFWAVGCVFQLSVVSLVVSMLSTPFRALIIAHEAMRVFAYCSVFESFAKLAAVLFLSISAADHLVLYSGMMLGITFGVFVFYYFYCSRRYPECRYSFVWDVQLMKGILGYTSWNVVGNLALVGKNQGVNALLNVFFGPVVNAAQGISYQVLTNVNQFVANFMTATAPQITKSYSAGRRSEMLDLVLSSSKYSFLLLFVVALPVVIEAPYLLSLWLESVPAGTVLFTRLALVNALVDSFSMPTAYAIQATGKVRNYQLSVGGTLMFIVPLGYVAVRFFGAPAEFVVVVSILLSAVAQCVRVIFAHRNLGLDYSAYWRNVLVPAALVALSGCVLPFLSQSLMPQCFLRLILVCVVSLVSVAASIWFLALNSTEKEQLVTTVRRVLHLSSV